MPYGFQYVVLLNTVTTLAQNETVTAIPIRMTENGFTINCYDNRNPPAALVPNITVHWAVRSVYNE